MRRWLSARAVVRLVFFLMLVCSMWTTRPASAEPLCAGCEIQLGLGGTYHFWGSTDGVVVPLTVSWDENRYEVGVFRMATRQTLTASDTSSQQALADPYWGVSASRRWVLLERGPVRAFFGFGLAYRTESDALTATRWDFASQLGLRVRLPRNGSAMELTFRHWSNGGIKLPNRGQDFATLTFLLNPQFFRTARLDRGHDLPPIRGHESEAESPIVISAIR
jgi:hypothetical protein